MVTADLLTSPQDPTMQNCKLRSCAQEFLLQVCDNIWVWSGDKHYLSKYQMVVVQNGYVRVGLVRLYG